MGQGDDRRGRRAVLLRRLRAVLRARTVRPLHLHVRQRRRAPRTAPRLHARRRRPAVARPRRLHGRDRGRLRHQLPRRRLTAPGERRDDRRHRARPRRGDRRRTARGSHRRPLPRHRHGAQRGGVPDQHRVRRSRHRVDHAPGPARRRTPDGPAAGTSCAPGCCSPWSRGSWRTPPSSSPTPTGGRCAARPAAGPRTASTPIAITDDGAEILTERTVDRQPAEPAA